MVKTTDIGGGKQYATVPARLKEFREANPRALVETKPEPQADGGVIFYARILTDKSDTNSAEATGTAYYNANEIKKVKAFEKLETISVGRALALLGYLNNGEIATSEETAEYTEFMDQKIEEAVDQLKCAPTIDDLKDVFMNLGSLMAHSQVIEAKNKRKEELLGENN